MTELIIIDENQKLSCFQKCKIVINKIEKRLSLFPNTDGIDFISINFVEKCYQKNKVLCFFPSNNESKKFMLVFKNDAVCKQVYDVVNDNMIVVSENDEKFAIQIFAPILAEIKDYNSMEKTRLTEIIIDFVKSLEEKEKEQFLVLVKESKLENIYSALSIHDNSKMTSFLHPGPHNNLKHLISNIQQDVIQTHESNGTSGLYSFMNESSVNERRLSLRKRPYINKSNYVADSKSDDEFENEVQKEYNDSDENIHVIKKQKISVNVLTNLNLTIDPENYKTVTYEVFGKLKTRLLIFTSPKKDFCYEYYWDNTQNYFICCGCATSRPNKKLVNAIKTRDINGNECIKLKGAEHICEPIEYNPEKYKDQEIVKASDFKFYERWSYGKMVQKLAIFLNAKHDLCYEYSKIKENSYQCFKCLNVNKKHFVCAKHIEADTNEETFIHLSHVKHICKPQKFDGDLSTTKNFVKKPNFKLESYENYHGMPKIRLSIFDLNDSSLCYTYHKSGKYFVCYKCSKLKKYIAARIWKDENGEDFFELFNIKHACKPQKYVPISNDSNTEIEDSNASLPEIEEQIEMETLNNDRIFTGLKNDENIIKKLNYRIDHIAKTDGSLIQELTIFDSANSCLSYIYYFHSRDKVFICSGCKSKGKYIKAKFHPNENNEESFIELGKAKHVCQPQPNEKILQSHEFKLQKDGNGKFLKLFIFNSEDKKFCYHFSSIFVGNKFRCKGCYSKDLQLLQAKIFENENKEYYVKMGSFEHVCTPIKYEEIIEE